jgi:ABC-2 type transport system ATP-binding protein
MSKNVLEVKNLVKTYKDYNAVNDISFTVPKGRVVGFLGPNGAGKTTTIQMLIGITEKTSGSITYFDKEFAKNKEASLSRINFTSAFNTLLGRISVYENLLVYANLYGVKKPKEKVYELSEYFELKDIYKEVYWNLSSGQKTRVNLVKSLLNDPELILMDEPTASLDPDVADKTLALIEKLREERQLSILYTSHNMDEITRICDEVIFLDKGKIVAQDTPLNLTKRIDKSILILIITNKEIAQQILTEKQHQYSFKEHNRLEIQVNEKNIAPIILELSSKGVEILDIEIQKPDLEDVFLHIARKGEPE